MNPPTYDEMVREGRELEDALSLAGKRVEEANLALASANARKRFMEDAEKPLLASLANARDEGGVEARKLHALAAKDYRDHLEKKHRAQHDAEMLWVKLEGARAEQDVARARLENYRSRWSFARMQIEKGLL
jgi:hypothetical protein